MLVSVPDDRICREVMQTLSTVRVAYGAKGGSLDQSFPVDRMIELEVVFATELRVCATCQRGEVGAEPPYLPQRQAEKLVPIPASSG